MIKLPLTKGRFALVDDDSPDEITGHKWQFDGRYVMRFEKLENGKFKKIYLHIAIAKPDKGLLIDHENGDKLDNQKANLRFCTYAQNMQNRKPTKGHRYKGVMYYSKSNKFGARITNNGKTVFLGLFLKPEDAAKAYDRKAIELFGEFARVNTYD